MKDEWDELIEKIEGAKVITIQKPPPIPHALPYGTPSPEDAIIEILDYGKKETN